LKITKTKLSIQGAYELTFPVFSDERGELSRIYCQEGLSHAIDSHIKQINLSTSYKKGTVRGLHWQVPPDSEIKVVQCVGGSVFDVIVDLRKDSKTFLSWIAVELSKEKHNAVIIPKGCAHGFQALTNNVQMIYYHTANFNPISERSVHYTSEHLAIKWPLPISAVSDKDESASPITSGFLGYHI
jgi:dTDP-4-dehydrorhamnose 3,5-epimerase